MAFDRLKKKAFILSFVNLTPRMLSLSCDLWSCSYSLSRKLFYGLHVTFLSFIIWVVELDSSQSSDY